MFQLNRSDSLFTQKNAILLADIFLVYTILAPIILNVIGSYVKLGENFIRTSLMILGPALISCIIYIHSLGFPLKRENIAVVTTAICLILIVFISSLTNWDSNYSKESLKFFLSYCVFGFFLGITARNSIQRIKNFNLIWIYYILAFLLFSMFLFVTYGFSDYRFAMIEDPYHRFTLPGDNSARTTALFLFFILCTLTNFLISKTLTSKLFCVFITILCVFIALSSNSRSAIAVFVIVLFSYVLFLIFQSKSSFQRLSLISFFAVFVLFLSCVLVWLGSIDKDLKNRISSIIWLPGKTITYFLNNDQTAYKEIKRFPIWRSAVSKFMDNPVLGEGFGSDYNNEVVKIKFRHPHNILLQFLAETGIIGIGTFLIFIFLVLKKFIHDYKSLQTLNEKITYAFYPISFVFFLLFSCFHFAIHENYFFWYFAGMIVGFQKNENGKISPQESKDLQLLSNRWGSM